MRTKTLLLTAALSAAGVAASMAQVYSVNVVGYVNVTVPANKFAILANPLNNTDNKLGTIMPLPDTADGAFLYQFDAQNQRFKDPLTFVGGFGWYNGADPNNTLPALAPGEGFFLQAPLTQPLNITFVGEVPQGNLSYPLAGNGRLTLVGSMVPQATKLGDPSQADTMNFPAADGDFIYLWDAASNNYSTHPYTYVGGFGWYADNDEQNPAGPVIPVASGFWVLKGLQNAAVNWTRTFNVQ